MTTQVSTQPQAQSLLAEYATKHGLDPKTMGATLVNTIFPSGKQPTQSQVFALLIVAQKYGLDPFLKEIYAFPAKGGGIIPIVSVDGWYHLMNANPNYDGCTAELLLDEKGEVIGCKATVHRKDRAHPIEVTELVSECSTGSPPWKKSPGRMIRHRAICQAARIAFSLSGIYDPDEAEAIRDAQYTVAVDGPEIASGSTVDEFQAAIEAKAREAEESDPDPDDYTATFESDDDGNEWEIRTFPDGTTQRMIVAEAE